MHILKMLNGDLKVNEISIFINNLFYIDFSASNHALKYDCCPTLYPYVLYTIQIRRRSLYYFTNIVCKKRKT